MAAERVLPEDCPSESLTPTSSLLLRTQEHHEKGTPGNASLQGQHPLSNLDLLQGPSELHRLPTPEPSPSPSLRAVNDTSPTEWNDTLGSVNGRHPASLEYVVGDRDEETLDGALTPPRQVSKKLSPHELRKVPEEKARKLRKASISVSKTPGDDKVLKLSPMQIEELTGTPESLPLPLGARLNGADSRGLTSPLTPDDFSGGSSNSVMVEIGRGTMTGTAPSRAKRSSFTSRAVSTPPANHQDPSWNHRSSRQRSPNRRASYSTPRVESDTPSAALRQEFIAVNGVTKPSATTPYAKPAKTPETENPPSPIPQDIPIPPMSIPTYLQLELASSRPSPLYIHRSSASEYPYESSKIKFERLLNFLLLPPQLEQVLGFGSLACLDAWLHTFTILPLRFVKASGILIQWWAETLITEAKFISGFIYYGAARMWHRQRYRMDSVDCTPQSRAASRSRRPSYQSQSPPESKIANGTPGLTRIEVEQKLNSAWGRKHKRTKSQPSSLSSYHKADLLQGSVIICSCMILMCLDASQMYHSIRGQSVIKLYMIWNMLEVGDRLLAALGQDIFECLFCEETIERGPDGRSKLLRPFGMFILALVYNVIHAAVLFCEVVTLNVAVNSYSNALLTLLMSNMFVEIKSTVFKKFEKDNIFQLTCADIVERFQLWLMLLIIGLRNIVEVGGWSISGNGQAITEVVRNGTILFRANSILPASFTILPNWSGEVLSPFIIVLGSEMIVDWLKHAYISKFNNVKPALYQKFLDVLAKDYYTNAFVNQNLTKRLGLPVNPLSCLFIRSCVQTYHMFLAIHLPTPIPSTATGLALESEAAASPLTKAALEHFDTVIRRALGRSMFGSGIDAVPKSWYMIGTDDIIAFITMLIFFLCAFLVLLVCKLVLGMVLLGYARNRYRSMKQREHLSVDTKGKRLGGLGMVEVDEDKRRWIYEDDPEGAKILKERERKAAWKARDNEKGMDFARVTRYEMAAKRIW